MLQAVYVLHNSAYYTNIPTNLFLTIWKQGGSEEIVTGTGQKQSKTNDYFEHN